MFEKLFLSITFESTIIDFKQHFCIDTSLNVLRNNWIYYRTQELLETSDNHMILYCDQQEYASSPSEMFTALTSSFLQNIFAFTTSIPYIKDMQKISCVS